MACQSVNPHYEVMVDCRQILLEKVEKDIIEGNGCSFLASQLFSAGIISGEELETIQEQTDLTEQQKAHHLVRWMEKKVELYPDRYDQIVNIFKQKPTIFCDLVPTLARKLYQNDDGDIIFESE